MENSPINRKSSLTLNRKHKLSESPKPSVRIVKNTTSPDVFGTPPSFRGNNVHAHSTPVTRKRAHLIEDSPSSQDYDNFIPISPSQDVYTNIVDVGWKWDDSPKASDNRKKSTNNNKQEKNKSSSTVSMSCPAEKRCTKQIKTPMEKKIQKSTKDNHLQQGFYKFREELMKIKTLENLNNEEENKNKEFNIKELDSSLTDDDHKNDKTEMEQKYINPLNSLKTTNIDKANLQTNLKEKSIVSATTTNKISSEIEFKTESSIVAVEDIKKFFDDSDVDNMLVELSQKVESEAQNPKTNINSISTTTLNKNLKSLQKEELVDNDSFDDILLSIPINDEKDVKKSTISNSNVKTVIPVSLKSNFTRYNSMPVTTTITSTTNKIIDNTKLSPRTAFIRYKSLPVSNNNAKINVIPSTSSKSSLSTLQSGGKTSNFSCSPDDIERRRQEAKQRLAMTMQKKLQQQQQGKGKPT